MILSPFKALYKSRACKGRRIRFARLLKPQGFVLAAQTVSESSLDYLYIVKP